MAQILFIKLVVNNKCSFTSYGMLNYFLEGQQLVTSFVLSYQRFHYRVQIVSVMSFDGEKFIQFFSKRTSDNFL